MKGKTAEPSAWLAAIGDFSADFRARLATRQEYEERLRSLLNHPQCPIVKLDIRASGQPECAFILNVKAVERPVRLPPKGAHLNWLLLHGSLRHGVQTYQAIIEHLITNRSGKSLIVFGRRQKGMRSHD